MLKFDKQLFLLAILMFRINKLEKLLPLIYNLDRMNVRPATYSNSTYGRGRKGREWEGRGGEGRGKGYAAEKSRTPSVYIVTYMGSHTIPVSYTCQVSVHFHQNTYG
jgi:hypothetical protein